MKRGWRLAPLAAALALLLVGCGGGGQPDSGAPARDGGEMRDAGAPRRDGGWPTDAGSRADAGWDAGAPPILDGGTDAGPPARRVALPLGGITTVGPRAGTGFYRVYDEGLETGARSCAGTVCVTGSIRP